ncbi:MAG: hypothetical protein O7D34_00045 [Ignavibacteria bacterium]|nr:hypothetical protein [Ignavibacteria bacterium]
MKIRCYLLVFALIISLSSPRYALSQDTTISLPLVKGGIYDRPYLFRPSSRVAIGGYAETMVRSEYEEGIFENVSFEARRFNIFLFSSISNLIKMTSELEFEHGTEEIKLETALIDVQFYEEFNLRGGILLSPLGKFNLAHDSPRNEFNDRPLVSTTITPGTLSEAGFGFYGSLYPFGDHRMTYETYLVNGLNDNIILAGDGTSIPSGRPTAFEEDNNGSPSFVGRLAWMPVFGGELGVSLHTGLYNTFRKEGLVVDSKRRLTIMVIDGEYQWGEATFQGEYARARIEIPTSLTGLFAETQQGFYGQAMYIVWRKVLPMFPKSSLSIGGRYDYVDFDTAVRGDDVRRLSVVTSLRLVPETVLKLDYQHSWIFDRLNNQTRAAVIQFGIATYF